MRDLAPDLAASLAGGVTTLAWCWRLTRRDGLVRGFTDHDQDIEFAGMRFEAASGMTATEMRDSVGLSVDDLQVESALSSERLDEGDLEAGRYDDARIEIFRVDWQQPASRVLVRVGTLGEVRRAGRLFTAEVRGETHRLQQPRGRLFQHACDAALGDARCGVDVAAAGRRWATTVAAVIDRNRMVLDGASPAAGGAFVDGVVEIAEGPRAGFRSEIKRESRGADGVRLTLWRTLPSGVGPGTAVVTTVGCDKHIATCRNTFGNAVNFRGFPHMPGNDFLTSVSRPGDPAQSGGSE